MIALSFLGSVGEQAFLAGSSSEERIRLGYAYWQAAQAWCWSWDLVTSPPQLQQSGCLCRSSSDKAWLCRCTHRCVHSLRGLSKCVLIHGGFLTLLYSCLEGGKLTPVLLGPRGFYNCEILNSSLAVGGCAFDNDLSG